MTSTEVGSASVWRLWVDTGGTFTDCLALAPDGAVERFKLLSDGSLRGHVRFGDSPVEVVLDLAVELPAGFLDGLDLELLGEPGRRARISKAHAGGRLEIDPPLELGSAERAEIRFDDPVPILAARIATRSAPGTELPPLRMRLATTRATNALLERSGAATVLVITAGFGDLLEIGNQQRPDLFALSVERPAPFYVDVIEVDERVGAAGEVVRQLDVSGLRERARQSVERGCVAAAVVSVNSYAEPRHEVEVERELLAAGFSHVTRSAEAAPLIGAVQRGETAVVDAYLAPDLAAYLGAVEGALRGGSLRLMTSAGGLQSPAELRPKDCLLSGPAGGVVGAVRSAAEVGVERVISFDMGGTSTDVARFDCDFEYRFQTELGGARVMAPSLAIETVAAGGGSICRFDGHRLRVGPRSAGARPGPACYGAGGPLTLTDVDVLLGRLGGDRFEIPLLVEAAEAALEELLAEVRRADADIGADAVLAGLLEIADERMAEAIRGISVRHGYDPARYLLVAFGGAGGQHACAVAELLGMRRILIPTDASLLSAWGLGHAVVEHFAARQILQPLAAFESRAAELFGELEAEAVDRVVADGVPVGEIAVRRRLLMLRLAGQDATLTVDYRPADSIETLFQESYRDHFGYHAPARPVEVESARVVASSRPPGGTTGRVAEPRPARPRGRQRAWIDGAWDRRPVYDRDELEPGAHLEGPALVVERFSSVVVASGWHGRMMAGGGLLLQRGEP